MTNTEFNKELKNLSNKKGFLDITKIKAAPEELKRKLLYKIVKHRHPVVIELIPESELSWLHSMGYLYTKKGKIYNFLCTCENLNKAN